MVCIHDYWKLLMVYSHIALAISRNSEKCLTLRKTKPLCILGGNAWLPSPICVHMKMMITHKRWVWDFSSHPPMITSLFPRLSRWACMHLRASYLGFLAHDFTSQTHKLSCLQIPQLLKILSCPTDIHLRAIHRITYNNGCAWGW